ncbi:glucose-6-phosphate dehydrogenase [Aerococcaceae bacterium DSM 111020]|nr:glucose-6-phosphate dehydrogenase [Aerococcaceae bacterium DSM 111020]
MKDNQLILTLFGATGDLAARKLYPAIYRLYKAGNISDHFAVIGTARRDWSHEYFRDVVYYSIKDEITQAHEADEFLSHFYYQAHDVNDADHYQSLATLMTHLDNQYQIGGNRIFYISLNPVLFPVITHNLRNQGLLTDNGYNRLIIEKPFGFDEASAIELQIQLTKDFNENQIFRIDHYLGKELLSSFRKFRCENLWAHFWSKDYIDNIQISLAEDLGIGQRGAYYERSGVTKDMIQNHMMQIIALLVMEQPCNPSAEAFRQEKIDMIKSLKKYQTLDEFKKHVVRGQYKANRAKSIPGYRGEDAVDPESLTETFFAAHIELDLPQWEGVPFFIRSGKRLERKYTTIHIVFKAVDEHYAPNYLKIELDPQMRIQYYFNQEKPGYNTGSKVVPMTFQYRSDLETRIPHDYERLINGCINNRLDDFVHWYESKYAWQFIDHLYDYWDQLNGEDLAFYEALSPGPEAANELTKAHGTRWYDYQC